MIFYRILGEKKVWSIGSTKLLLIVAGSKVHTHTHTIATPACVLGPLDLEGPSLQDPFPLLFAVGSVSNWWAQLLNTHYRWWFAGLNMSEHRVFARNLRALQHTTTKSTLQNTENQMNHNP